VALLAVAPPKSAGAQGTFEGMVAYRMSGMNGEMRYYQKGEKIRQQMQMPSGETTITIYDGANGESIVLMPSQKKYVKMNFKAMGAAAGKEMAGMGQGRGRNVSDISKMKVTPTGERETIAGVACEHYLFESTDAKEGTQVDICGATGMGFMGSGHGGAQMFSTAALLEAKNPELAKLAKAGFFPLKMTMTDGKRGKPMVMEATDLERGKLDAGLFAVPDGYSELVIPGMPARP
jgi:hypothetical protein